LRYTISFCHGLLILDTSPSVFSLPPYPRMTRMERRHKGWTGSVSQPGASQWKGWSACARFRELAHLTCLIYHLPQYLQYCSQKLEEDCIPERFSLSHPAAAGACLLVLRAGKMLTCWRGLHVAGFVFFRRCFDFFSGRPLLGDLGVSNMGVN
jgi:hypothetical protein